MMLSDPDLEIQPHEQSPLQKTNDEDAVDFLSKEDKSDSGEWRQESSSIDNINNKLNFDSSTEARKDRKLKTDLLHVSIVDIYCSLQKVIKKYAVSN